MQTLSAAMQTALSAHESGDGSFQLIELVEVYAYDYTPHATNGYEPSAAEKSYAGVLGFTFTGEAYDREYVGRGSIRKFLGKAENNVDLNFSNVTRNLAAWVVENQIEGKQVVVRLTKLDQTGLTLADSVILFIAKLEKPGDFSDDAGELSGVSRFGSLNLQFPVRTYGPNDPEGRAPSDPLFEGFRFSPVTSSVQYTTREIRGGFLGLFSPTRSVSHSMQVSSKAGFEALMPVADAFGRVQLPHVFLGTIDIGGAINIALSFCEGLIAEYENVRQINPKFSQPIGLYHRYGYLGGQGPVGREQVPPGFNYPAQGYYSRLAHVYCYVTGSTPDVDEAEAPAFTALIKAKIIPLPDGSGAFTLAGWSHSPAYIARFLFTDERYFNEGANAVDDPTCIETANHCAEMVLDTSQGERVFIAEADAALYGAEFSRYRSTGLMDAQRIRRAELGTLTGDAYLALAIPEPVDPTDPPAPFDPPTVPGVRETYLRERYTCNLTITQQTSAVDFLYNTLAPTGRLMFRRDSKGKIQILSEKPGDFTRLRTATAIGATTLPVMDVEPWKTGRLLTQRLLIGNGLTTSEVRDVTTASYTADGNAVTLAASVSGTVTATASGATLSGGSSSVAASGTVTIGGTPASGNSVTVTVNGLAVIYTLDSYDSTATAAAMLARLIEATPKLRSFIKATWNGANVVTLAARYGVLTLSPSSALAFAHTAQLSAPSAAPVGTPGAGGALPAGTYYLAHAYTDASGETSLSPTTAVVVTAGQLITVSSIVLPAGALKRRVYVSKYANSPELVLYAENTGASFNIGQTSSSVPDSTAATPSGANSTGEELLRVAMSFATNDQGATVLAQAGLTKANIHRGTFKWPLGGKQSSVNYVAGTFFNAVDDFAATPLEVHDYEHQTRTRKKNKKEVDLSGFDSYHQASRYANFILSKNREGDSFASWSTGVGAVPLEEGDLVCVSAANYGVINLVLRLEEVTIGSPPPEGSWTVSLLGRKYSTLMFSDEVRQHTIPIPTTLRHAAKLNTTFQFLDLPPWRDKDAALGPHFQIAARRAAGTGDWKGASVWVDTGEGYVRRADIEAEATIGDALTVLANHAPGLDTTSTVRVRLLSGGEVATLASVTDAEFRQRANLFRLGGEIFQAKTATLVVGTTHDYDLSYLHRGLDGTESYTTGHAIGDDFAALDGSILAVALDAAHAGQVIGVKVATHGQDVADATAQSVTWLGLSRKPLAIARVDLEEGTSLAPRDKAGSILIQCWPRTNLERIGDEYLAEFLSDDRATVIHSQSFTEGLPQAALLISNGGLGFGGKFAHITVSPSGNTLGGSGAVTTAHARALQIIRATENFAEAKLRGTADATIRFGLLSTGLNWRAATPQYYFELAMGGGGNQLNIYDPTGLIYTEDPSAYQLAGKRFRLIVEEGQVKFYKDWSDDGTPPIAVSAVAPNYPLYVKGEIGIGSVGSGYVENVTLSTNPLPASIFTAAQQQEHYAGLKSPLQVRIRQHSGIREIGHGLEWNGAI